MSYGKKEIVIAALALLAGWFLTHTYYSKKEGWGVSLIRENSTEYQYINPILLVDNSKVEFEEYDSLRSKIEKVVSDMKDDNLADDISVYFRDLNSAKWTGVNEDALYDPSSMVKVITLLAYLHIAQNDPEVLSQRLPYTYTPDPGQNYKPQKVLYTGEHTIRELLIHMIDDSDNKSMHILNDYRPDKIQEVFKELDLPSALTVGQGYMSAADYSRVFRALYSSTYLSRPYSEEALKLLSKTSFDLGLVAGVDEEVEVAHKFGEHTFTKPNGELLRRELHDCGIVYKIGSPYFLCVMTKGNDFKNLEKVISGISSTVFQELK